MFLDVCVLGTHFQSNRCFDEMSSPWANCVQALLQAVTHEAVVKLSDSYSKCCDVFRWVQCTSRHSITCPHMLEVMMTSTEEDDFHIHKLLLLLTRREQHEMPAGERLLMSFDEMLSWMSNWNPVKPTKPYAEAIPTNIGRLIQGCPDPASSMFTRGRSSDVFPLNLYCSFF